MKRMKGLECVVAALLVGAWAALITVGAAPVSAELVGYDMSSSAQGIQLFTIIPDQQVQPEMNIPAASSALSSGTGYGLASAAWPGATVANGATLLPLLIPGFPQEVAALMAYPIRAEARTGQDPPTTVYDVPGLTMRARADTTAVESEAGTQGLAVLPGTFGVARATSSNRALEYSVKATARSVVQNLDIGGVLKIDQVVSTATAISDGERGTGTATTVVTGATVNGNPVFIDGKGLHAGPSNQPIDAVTNQINQQALNRAGINVSVGPATSEMRGASAVVGATSIVITFTQNGYTLGYTLGGARAAAVAGLSDDLGDSGDGGFSGGPSEVLGSSDSFDGGFDTGSFDTGVTGDGSDIGSLERGAVAVDGPPDLGIQPTLASAHGRQIPKAGMLLGLVAALLFAVGLRRLSATLLADPTAAMACPLPGDRA